jgi:hypothetical protein
MSLMEQCSCAKCCNTTWKTATETYTLLKVAFDDKELSQSTMLNGANVSKVFENCRKISTVLATHSYG